MLETPHVAVGIALASKFPNPWIAIPLSVASHFVLDRVPHWNPHIYTETVKNGKPMPQSTLIAMADIGFAFFMGSAFAYKALPDYNSSLLILACSLGSVASDVVKYPFYYFGWRNKYLLAWVKFERTLQVDTKSVFWGLVTQALVIAASFLWIANS